MKRVADTWATVRRSEGAGKVIPIELSDAAIPADIADKLGAKRLGSDFVFFDGDGKKIAHFTIDGGLAANPMTATDVATFASGYQTAQAGLLDWEKAKTGEAKAAALRKIGAAPTDEGKAILTEAAERTSNADLIRKAGIDGLTRQRDTSSALVGYLTDKSATVRTAASAALKAQGFRALAPLVGALAAPDAETRGAAGQVVVGVVKIPALTRTAEFWRTGKDADRDAALGKLRQWLVEQREAMLAIPKK